MASRRTLVFPARPAGLEPATGGLEERACAPQSEALRDVVPHERSDVSDHDLRCFTVLHDDSSRIVMELGAECKDANPETNRAPGRKLDGLPMTSDDALRLAIKLAVDAGDFERAIALLEVAKRVATRTAIIAPSAGTNDCEE
jgi:hypothetical protein